MDHDFRAVEQWSERRYGRPAVWFPSGRLALYVALRRRLEPGARLLLSPLTDDVVGIVVLAAGLRPVFAPLDPADGNIDVGAVPEAVWAGVDGVLTTNLYGLPERSDRLRSAADRHGLALIEDVAHGLIVDEPDGTPLGHRGDALVLSLAKHGEARRGGVLVASSATDAIGAREARDGLVRPAGMRSRARTVAAATVRALGLDRATRALRDRLVGPIRPGHRMEIVDEDLAGALASPSDLDATTRWMGVDERRYRERATARDPGRASAAVSRAEQQADRRREGVARLRALPAVAAAVRAGDATPLFRVPLLVEDRLGATRRLADAGITVDYVYDPPLDDLLAPRFADPSPDPAPAAWFGSHVLPVDPRHADRVLAIAAAHPDAFRPAAVDASRRPAPPPDAPAP